MEGTFRIEAGGVELTYNDNPDFNYNVGTYNIRTAVRSHYDSDEIEVQRVMPTHTNMDIKMVIHYIGLKQAPSPLTFNLTGLSGERSGTSPISTLVVHRFYSSTRPLYSLPLDFLYTAS